MKYRSNNSVAAARHLLATWRYAASDNGMNIP